MTPALALACLTVLALALSLGLTGLVRRYALKHQIIDEVSARSSHSVPTPRGGGIAIVLTFMTLLAASVPILGTPLSLAAGLIGGGIVVAGIGWIDDHGHVSAGVRLAAHFAGALIMVWVIGPLPLTLPLAFLPIGWADWVSWPLSVIGAVWLINLYNFMDGIDGLAGGEAIAIAGLGGILAMLAGQISAQVAPYALLTAASAGFLFWNWPPAKIFMGDAGSGFLGLAMAGLILWAGRESFALAAGMMILAGVFLSDATFTLLRRVLRREKIHEAHRTHAYQFLSRRAGRHLPVTTGALAINLVWLFPLALLVAAEILSPVAGLVIAFGPLLVGAWFVGAGLPEAD